MSTQSCAQNPIAFRLSAAVLAVLQMFAGGSIPVYAQGNDKDNSHVTQTPIQHVIVIIGENISFKWYGDQWNIYKTDPYYQNPADVYCNICNFLQYSTSIMTNPALVAAHIQDTTDLYNDIQNNTLPAVSFVKPSGLVDGHPASSKLDLFEGFTKKIVDMVQANPKVWADSAILVTFDEGGGYYDSGYVQPVDFFGDGTRIPLLAISRFTKPGDISHQYNDHVSILKFIEYNWKTTAPHRPQPRQPSQPQTEGSEPLCSNQQSRHWRSDRSLRLRQIAGHRSAGDRHPAAGGSDFVRNSALRPILAPGASKKAHPKKAAEIFNCRYTTQTMRRILAIALLIAFGSPLVAPLVAATADREASLPACCRSHGAHGCAMTHRALAGSSGPVLQAPPCSNYPTAFTPVPTATAFLGVASSLSIGIRRDRAALPASGRYAPATFVSSANLKRGPPTLLA